MDRRVALVTGITGQDGSYLAELLLDKGYTVHGVIRRSSSFNTQRLDPFFDKLHLHYGDLTDPMGLRRILSQTRPDEIYNLGAQSHVKVSFDQPIYTANTVAMGTLHVLEAVRDYRDTTNPNVRLYQASSSEMFGASPPPQNESTAFNPRSPYACSKVFAHHQAIGYRDAYGLWIGIGILFNHESPRRGETFVTRKITRAAGRIKCGLQEKLLLGNLDAKRDWGFAGDYAEAMWRMLQHSEPDVFVIATGQSWTVREWLELAFSHVDLDWTEYVVSDSRYLRPTEVESLCGDASKAERVLGWTPTVNASELCRMMMDSDLQLAEWEAHKGRFDRGESLAYSVG